LPVQKGWLSEEISTSTTGYISPSSHSMVRSLVAVDRGRKAYPAARSRKTTGW
jgi:hypothetical protein